MRLRAPDPAAGYRTTVRLPQVMQSQPRNPQDVVLRIAQSPDRRLAWEFFVTFSRFEYALKRSGFLKKKYPHASPDWDEFARQSDLALGQRSDPGLAEAVAYYDKHPPRKQLQNEGALGWSEPIARRSNELDLEFLCRKICTVRNNLFHGGKFPKLPIADPSRDQDLLRSGKDILFALVDLNKSVQRHFFEGIDE